MIPPSPWLRVLTGFDGTAVPDWITDTPPPDLPAGFILGRHHNVEDIAQVAALTASLQQLAPPARPFLISADEEGGQLSALIHLVTPFPGPMALAATGDVMLAHRVALATATELRALGINVVWAPVADVATVAHNPSLGVRSFGDDPAVVADFVAAMVDGYQSAGVAASAKHFLGQGEAVVDPHHELPVIDLPRHRLEEVEMAPFRRAIAAGVEFVMVGHYAVPAITGSSDRPLSASRHLRRILRDDLGFDGVIVSDALDMGAFTRTATTEDVVAAGVDLLLCMADRSYHQGAADAVAADGAASHRAAVARLSRLRRKLDTNRPPLDTIRSTAHMSLAAEVAQRALTVVRSDPTLPLATGGTVLAVMPQPAELTPADTSAFQPPLLAAALRRHHPAVTEIVVPVTPGAEEIDGVLAAAGRHDVVVVGTIAAHDHPGQAAMVNRLLATHPQVVTVALRTPFDLPTYPAAKNHICTYSVLEPSMNALADALFGHVAVPGRLPVAIRGIAPSGFHAKMPR